MKGHLPSDESIEFGSDAKPIGFEEANMYSEFFNLEIESLEIPNDVKLIIVKPDYPGQKVFLLEPFTWGFVAISIAQGILGAVGAKIFNSLFQEQGVNLESLINEILNSISNIIKQAIAEDALRRAQSSLSGLQQTLLDYNNSPDSSIARLDAVSIKVNDLIAEFESFRLVGFASYTLTTTIRLAILQERLIRFGATGEQANINRTVVIYNQHLGNMVADYNNWIAGRFPPSGVELRYIKFGNTKIPVGWQYTADGNKVGSYPSPEAAERGRFEAAVTEFNNNWEKVIGPERILREKFNALVK
jgi:hypothetical protein